MADTIEPTRFIQVAGEKTDIEEDPLHQNHGQCEENTALEGTAAEETGEKTSKQRRILETTVLYLAGIGYVSSCVSFSTNGCWTVYCFVLYLSTLFLCNLCTGDQLLYDRTMSTGFRDDYKL